MIIKNFNCINLGGIMNFKNGTLKFDFERNKIKFSFD